MSNIQLSFSLRVSAGVKTVHLLGSWDNYVGQLPLSKDKSSSKSGSWKGTFRFSGSTLEPGQRYWYYYIIDGYHVSHNPSEESTVEPTTGRNLNILDLPKAKSSSKSSSGTKSSSRHSSSKDKSSSSSKRSSRHHDIAKGRPLSTSQIKAPKPTAPHATRHILDADYDYDNLADHLGATTLDEYDGYAYAVGVEADESDDDAATDISGPSSASSPSDSDLSYRSSPNSSVSGYSTPSSDCSSCTCERYGITRKGDRVRLDCGGSRCGYDDSCSSSEDDEYNNQSARRNGIVVR